MFKKENIEVITLLSFMQGVYGNQTMAAKMLGINRATLRKYLNSEELCFVAEDHDGYKFFTELQSRASKKTKTKQEG